MIPNIPNELEKHHHFSRYQRMWQKNPQSVVFVPMAQICREQGFLETAQSICEEGLKQNPASVSGRLMLASIFFELSRSEEALEIIKTVLQEYPGQQEALVLLAKMKQDEELTEKSSISSSLCLWENLTMARIYADQGEKRIALSIIDKLLFQEPANQEALNLKEKLK